MWRSNLVQCISSVHWNLPLLSTMKKWKTNISTKLSLMEFKKWNPFCFQFSSFIVPILLHQKTEQAWNALTSLNKAWFYDANVSLHSSVSSFTCYMTCLHYISWQAFFIAPFFSRYQGPWFYHPQPCWSKHFLKLCTAVSQAAPTLQDDTWYPSCSEQLTAKIPLSPHGERILFHMHTHLAGTAKYLHSESLHVNSSISVSSLGTKAPWITSPLPSLY